MAVTLSLREPVSLPVEVDGVLSEKLRGFSVDSIRRLPLTQGNARPELGELFDVTGSPGDDDTLVWEGDLRAVKRIGEGLSSGRILVNGPAGMHLGSGMTGGSIEVSGDVTDWAGAEMRGGLIRIHGSAGDCVGGGYRGSIRGMTGGEILIAGDAGDEVGRVMRRGVIAIGGSCGQFCGSKMIAGNIFVGGQAGGRVGSGMKRGAIGVFGGVKTGLLPSFERAGTMRPLFLQPFAGRLCGAGMDSLARAMRSVMERWCGDRLTIGLGEILVPVSGG
jgi:formylmethanofuran dehydrogenase subunit C